MSTASFSSRRPLHADPRVLETTILGARTGTLPSWHAFETLRDIARADRVRPRAPAVGSAIPAAFATAEFGEARSR